MSSVVLAGIKQSKSKQAAPEPLRAVVVKPRMSQTENAEVLISCCPCFGSSSRLLLHHPACEVPVFCLTTQTPNLTPTRADTSPQSCKINFYSLLISAILCHLTSAVTKASLILLLCLGSEKTCLGCSLPLYSDWRKKKFRNKTFEKKGETTQLYPKMGKGRKRKREINKKSRSQNGCWGRRKMVMAS